MNIAILGLPQSGKRTLFSLLTGREVSEFRKAGETLEGMALVHDPRVDAIALMENPEKITYAQTEIVLCTDIEPGSGKYVWLEQARYCDLLCMVVREFTAGEVYHPLGSVDAHRDKETLAAELILADLDLTEKRIERIEKEKKTGKPGPDRDREMKLLDRCKEALEQERMLNTLSFSEEERPIFRRLNFLTGKPVLWCFNVDENSVEPTGKNQYHEEPVFRISALIEKEIQSLNEPADREEYLQALGLRESGLDRLNASAYDHLGLMSFYTMGKDEVRAWTIRKGTVAPYAGGKIHSDIERGFIRVEVIKYDDLIIEGSEDAVKIAGKFQLKGKTYVLEDGDICCFRFNV